MLPPSRSARVLIVLLIAVLAVAALAAVSPAKSRAAGDSTVPPPPSMIPTPIGGPPNPPTPVATATSAAPGPTPTATHVSAASLVFTLDAARVSPVNDKGDRKGLTKVRRGQTVWLMMYFTVKSVPKATQRVTTYQLSHSGKPVYHASYKGTESAKDIGEYSRYVPVTLGATLAPGRYHFVALLTIGTKTQKRSWSFDLVKG